MILLLRTIRQFLITFTYEFKPNPFRDFTTIKFNLPEDSPVTLHVYDLTGRRVATLLDNESTIAGNHQVRFDGNGHPSGVYIFVIQAGAYTGTGKMNLIK